MAGYSTRTEVRLIGERDLIIEVARSPISERLEHARRELRDHLKEIGQRGDLAEIIGTERQILEFELRTYAAHSPAMKGSLDEAINAMAATERLIDKVSDPAAYRVVNEEHSLSRHRTGQVPNDEARQALKGHKARLLNLNKARLSPAECENVELRRAHIGRAERLGHFFGRNLDAGNSLADAKLVAKEMKATQAANDKAAANRTYHLVVSFREGDRPENEVVEDVVRQYVEALGFGDHQYVAGTHLNTNHYHVHVAINRVHPATGRAHMPFRDFRTLDRVSRAVETPYGL